ncbi:alpha/beta hydrolase [Oxalobacteraceae bacterium]|nr:alpha/beta hydrolase [Oxalobacteraceae bacterium]
MPNKVSHAADLRGLSRLTINAVTGVTELAEAVHLNILQQVPAPLARPLSRLTSYVYGGVRGATGLVGSGIERALAKVQPLLGEQNGWTGREALLAAVNGVLGDHLALSGNPLAITMGWRRHGQPLRPAALDGASGRIVVLAHGLCMNDLQWLRAGHDHGAMLERERGYTAVYLHYNSGRHISQNGRALSQQLQQLVDQWPVPVEELVIVGHSMGGLVARSACHFGAQARHSWPARLSKLVCLGSPHQGAPLERGGNWFHVLTDLSSYTAPFSRLAKIRSAGITDLRHGSLLDEDWGGKDRFAHGAALPVAVPLPEGVACYALAGTVGKTSGSRAGRLAGDGLVPLESALGRHDDPARQLDFAAERQAVVYRCNHMELLSSREVGEQLLAWL